MMNAFIIQERIDVSSVGIVMASLIQSGIQMLGVWHKLLHIKLYILTRCEASQKDLHTTMPIMYHLSGQRRFN